MPAAAARHRLRRARPRARRADRRAGFPSVDLTCLPATLHNRPERIPAPSARGSPRPGPPATTAIFVAYADCGTGGLLDRVLEEEGVERLAGRALLRGLRRPAAFAALAEEEPGTFYLTDFLARNFDRLVVRGLGLDRHPELLPRLFGNYRRLVYLAQTDDPELARGGAPARRRAARPRASSGAARASASWRAAMRRAARPHGVGRRCRRDPVPSGACA